MHIHSSGEDAAWASRIGHDSVDCRRRARTTAWAVGVALLVSAASAATGVWLAASTGDGPAPLPVVLVVAALFFVCAVGAILAWALVTSVVLPQRRRAQGYALRALLPTNPALRIDRLAPHLRRLDDFDRWRQAEGIAPYDPDAAPIDRWVWAPHQASPLLPGRPAAWWAGAASALLAAAFVALAGSALAELTPGGDGHAVALGVAAVVLGLVAAAARTAAAGRARREARTGYTTLVGCIRQTVIDSRTALDLVDARTGGLVRAAGALPLSSALYRARVRALRAPSQGTGWSAS